MLQRDLSENHLISLHPVPEQIYSVVGTGKYATIDRLLSITPLAVDIHFVIANFEIEPAVGLVVSLTYSRSKLDYFV